MGLPNIKIKILGRYLVGSDFFALGSLGLWLRLLFQAVRARTSLLQVLGDLSRIGLEVKRLEVHILVDFTDPRLGG